MNVGGGTVPSHFFPPPHIRIVAQNGGSVKIMTPMGLSRLVNLRAVGHLGMTKPTNPMESTLYHDLSR